MAMSVEMMDIVDDQDVVIGQASQEEVYKKFPLHRIFHVMVFDREGRIGSQRRSANKSYKPLHWTTAACGHPLSGETYEEAGQREGGEELGVNLVLTNFRKIKYEDSERPGLRRFLGVFEAVHKGPFNFNKEEVGGFLFKTKTELQKMIDEDELFHPEFRFILVKLYGLTSSQ